MDQPTEDILRPLVQRLLDTMTEKQWIKLESGSVDKVTEDIVTHMCVDIINDVSKCIYETFKKNLTEENDLHLTQTHSKSSKRSSGSDGSQKSVSISKNQVLQLLGNSIQSCLTRVLGVQEDIGSQSTKNLTDLVAEEVKERVNSELTKSCGSSGGSIEGSPQLASTGFTSRLKAIVRYVVKVLKECVAKMKCTSTFSSSYEQNSQQSPEMEADETKSTLEKSTEPNQELVESGESWQSPVTSLNEDGTETFTSEDSFEVQITEGLRHILFREAPINVVFPNNKNILDEEYRHFVSSSSEDTDKAASDIASLIIEEFDLDKINGAPKSGSQSEAKSSKTSCWKRVGNKVKAFFVHKFAKESILSLVGNLRSKPDCSPPDKDKLTQLMEGTSCLLEDMIPPEEDKEKREGTDEMCIYKRIASEISSGKHDIIAKQLTDVVTYNLKSDKGCKLEFRAEVQIEVDVFMKLMWNWLNQQAQQHERQRAVLRQIKRAVLAPTESPLVPMGDTLTPMGDTLTLVSEAAPDSDESAISGGVECPAQGWDELTSVILVSGLVNRILEDSYINLSGDDIKTTFTKLKNMLRAEISSSDITVNLRRHHVKRTVKAMYKDLCKKAGSIGVLRMSLLSEDEVIYKYIIETIKEHLVSPKKRRYEEATQIFTTVFKTMEKSFSACFRFGRKK